VDLAVEALAVVVPGEVGNLFTIDIAKSR